MKRIQYLLLSFLAFGLTTELVAQNDSMEVNEEIIIDMGGMKVVVKEKSNETTTNEQGDTVITKTETIEIITTEGEDSDDAKDIADLKELMKKFKEEVKEEENPEPEFIETSWNNFALGLNNLMNKDGKLETDAGYSTMNLDASKSINFDWKIVTQAMNLYKGKIRLVYGVGIDYNNYRFKNDIDLQTDSVPLMLVASARDYKKNKLVTQYLTVPVMLNFKFSPKHSNENIYISGGANLGYLIGSHQKKVWDDKGKGKVKTEDDYGLQDFRVGYEVQFGYKNIVLYGKYFPESIFKANEGPDLRTVSAGILIGKI
ncbi:MAG: outer membrane beta-barrel protein [Bacteroidia bacterium]